MRQRLLEILACPSCKGQLRLVSFERGSTGSGEVHIDEQGKEVISGLLKCGCGGLYPIIEGVPRFLENGLGDFPEFVERFRNHLGQLSCNCSSAAQPVQKDPDDDFENIRKSFSTEWGIFDSNSDCTWGWTLDERKAIFLSDINLLPDTIAGKRLLDAGCGNGTMTAALSEFGMEVVGLDLNDGLGAAYLNRGKCATSAIEGVEFVQANLLKLPLKEQSFDLIYSSGVIHHTPDSKAAFDGLVRMVNRGGRLYVWVYGKRALPVRVFFACGRYLKRRLSLKSLLTFCRCFSPIYKVGTELLDWLKLVPFRKRTTREITLDLFDAFSPRFNRRHTEDEVRSWFEEHNFRNIHVSGRQKHGFGMYGDRS